MPTLFFLSGESPAVPGTVSDNGIDCEAVTVIACDFSHLLLPSLHAGARIGRRKTDAKSAFRQADVFIRLSEVKPLKRQCRSGTITLRVSHPAAFCPMHCFAVSGGDEELDCAMPALSIYRRRSTADSRGLAFGTAAPGPAGLNHIGMGTNGQGGTGSPDRA